jgi:hypothetical protein
MAGPMMASAEYGDQPIIRAVPRHLIDLQQRLSRLS